MCYGLKDIKIPDSVTNIGMAAFSDCKEMEGVEIPAGVTYIGYGVFYNCENLIDISVNKNNTVYKSVDGVLFNKEMTEILRYPAGLKNTHYKIPNEVKSIGKGAFGGCKRLLSVEIPKGVEVIDDGAFYKCINLGTVKMEDGVNFIGRQAFAGCLNLKNVEIPNSGISIEYDAFDVIVNKN